MTYLVHYGLRQCLTHICGLLGSSRVEPRVSVFLAQAERCGERIVMLEDKVVAALEAVGGFGGRVGGTGVDT